LTNSQIKAAWPNLPTAEEIENNAKNGGIEYGEVVNNSITGSTIVNSTVLNPISFGSVAIPKMYDIFLYEGNTSWSQGAPVWIEVPETYLATSHPPSIPSVQVGYLLFHKKDVSKRCAGEEK
jgi:hypothetical protein